MSTRRVQDSLRRRRRRTRRSERNLDDTLAVLFVISFKFDSKGTPLKALGSPRFEGYRIINGVKLLSGLLVCRTDMTRRN